MEKLYIALNQIVLNAKGKESDLKKTLMVF